MVSHVDSQKVPTPEFYLVGGYLKEGTTRHDIDMVGVLGENAFKYIFDYDHKSLMKDYSSKPYPEKLQHYIMSCRLTGWAFTCMFGKYVDFKWILPSMLIDPEPRQRLHIEADVTMYL